MRIINKLDKAHIDSFLEISMNAHPYDGDKEGRKNWIDWSIDGHKGADLFGLFENGEMLGGMKLYDLKMNIHSTVLDIGGLGALSVDLLHRKERVAKELVEYFLKYYEEKGICMVVLNPFRVDFYKQMGFGMGTQVRQFRIKPEHFPRGDSKENLVFLTNDDKIALDECYNRYLKNNHGVISRVDPNLNDLFNSDVRIVAYKEDNNIRGYVAFSYPDNEFGTILIKEMVYDHRDVLLQLCTFLHTQLDQVKRIVVNTEDTHLEYIFSDPNNGENYVFKTFYPEICVTGIGTMYRVIDTKGLFNALQGHNFGGQNCGLKITLEDTLFFQNFVSTTVRFVDGKASIVDLSEHDVEIVLNVSHFSSLIMGAIDFHSLFRLGLVSISDDSYCNVVNNLFKTSNKPISMIHF